MNTNRTCHHSIMAVATRIFSLSDFEQGPSVKPFQEEDPQRQPFPIEPEEWAVLSEVWSVRVSPELKPVFYFTDSGSWGNLLQVWFRGPQNPAHAMNGPFYVLKLIDRSNACFGQTGTLSVSLGQQAIVWNQDPVTFH